MGKKTKSKSGGDFWDEDPELQAQNEQGLELGSSGFEVTAEPGDDEDGAGGSGGLMDALKRSKKRKDAKAAEDAENAAAAAASAAPVQIKSKKDKEREKKEREKAKKKALAQRKAGGKAAQEARQASEESKRSEASEEPSDQSREVSQEPESGAAEEPKAKGGKKKKLNPALAAIQKQQAARKAAEEAKKAKEEEERRLREERAKLAAEEEQALEEARLARKEKERKKKEELKAQGKLLTKKQKEQQATMARRREALLASGVQIEAVTGAAKAAAKASKSKSKPKPKEEEAQKAAVTPAPAPAATPEPTSQAPESEETSKEVSEEPKAPEIAEEEAQDALMDDWEAELSGSDDEKSKSEPTTPEQEAPKPSKQVEEAPKPQDPPKEENWKVLDAQRRAEVEAKREKRHHKAVAGASAKNLRSPICAILGHVDTGKTKLLDNMRKTNVQEGEAGGITQQIGATYFPIDMIEKKTAVMKQHTKVEYNVPGLLIIDTPGHESFSNLRSRGSSLCNIAILVVDILHGLEPQTLESIRLLRDRKTPFVVALNKVDRLYGWKSTPNNSFRESLAAQDESVQSQFEDRLEKTKLLFAEQGFNSEVYYNNRNMSKYVSLIPTSAVTGEGVPDLLHLLLELTQSRMSKQLMYLSELEATILEVKVVEGLGTTIDVVLSNGVIREGDRIVLCGMNGPISTNVRALLTPQPARELRIKSAYVHHKEIKAAMGVKISAPDLDQAVAGSRLLVVGPDDDEDEMMDDIMEDMTGLLDSVDKTGEGVCVQASTLGSLEALLDFLKDMKIPVMSIGLGPVFRRDVMRATTMLDRNKEFAVMLCFDVRVDKEAEHYANEQGVRIFTADIIYHLFDEFTKYQKQLLEQRRRDNQASAVFPAVLSIVQIINKRNPMIIGVDIVEGSLHNGTPIAVVKNDPVTKNKLIYPLGRIQSMEVDHKPRDHIRRGQANAGVAMRLDSGNMTNMPTWGRHIDEKDMLYSLISRKSIDTLKDPAFRDEVPREDWLLIKKLKTVFDIK